MTAIGDILWIAALGALFFYMMRKGGCCGGHGQNDHKGHVNNDGGPSDHQHMFEEKRTPESIVEKDPVCGMDVEKRTTSFASEHFGRTFRFCSERCRKLFDINPNRYARSA